MGVAKADKSSEPHSRAPMAAGDHSQSNNHLRSMVEFDVMRQRGNLRYLKIVNLPSSKHSMDSVKVRLLMSQGLCCSNRYTRSANSLLEICQILFVMFWMPKDFSQSFSPGAR